MANFVPILAVLDTTEQTVYTCPSGKSAIVKLLQVTNSNTLVDYYVTVSVASGSNTFYIAYQFNVPALGGVQVLAGDLYLTAGQSIKAVAETGTYLHLIGSVVEV